jgi:thiol-disulfide isomerase/thioredoxin
MKSKKHILHITFFILTALFSTAWVSQPNHALEVHKAKNYSDSLDIQKYNGKYVILNFWASWSKTSRTENKNLVRIYEKYRKNPKIAFVSVSLDVDDASWKNAINEDGLLWLDHVCDYKKYASPIALQYNVKTLPMVYILGKDGQIIQSSPNLIDLEPKIDELLK